MDTTVILQAAGGDGKFQLIMGIILESVRLMTMWSLNFMAFAIYIPPAICEDFRQRNISGVTGHPSSLSFSASPSSSDFSYTLQKDSKQLIAIDVDPCLSSTPVPGHTYNVSQDPCVNFTESTGTRNSTHFLSPFSLLNDSVGSVTTVFANSSEADECRILSQCENIVYPSDSSTIMSEWDLVCDREWLGHLILSLQMAGCLVGCLVAGQLGERFGRRLTTFLFTALLSVEGVASVFAGRWEIFAALRFLMGFSHGAILTMSMVYLIEFLGPKGRSWIKMSPFGPFSMLIQGVITYFVRDWKHLMVIEAVILALLCLSALWTPESIRWLYTKGKMEEFKAAVRKISSVNGRGDCLKDLDMCLIDKEVEEIKSNYRDLFKCWHQTRITLSAAIASFSINTVMTVFDFGIKAFQGDFYINLLIYSATELPVPLIVIPAVKCMGNRHSMGTFLFLCLLGTGTIAILSGVTGTDGGMTVTYIALVAKFFLIGALQVGDAYMSEVFPTSLRSVGYGFVRASGMCGGILAPFLIPSTPDLMAVSFCVVSVLALVACGLVQTMPETKSSALHDVTVVTHSEDSVV